MYGQTVLRAYVSKDPGGRASAQWLEGRLPLFDFGLECGWEIVRRANICVRTLGEGQLGRGH